MINTTTIISIIGWFCCLNIVIESKDDAPNEAANASRYLIISCILHNKPCKMLSLEQIVGFSTYFNSCGNSKGKLSLNLLQYLSYNKLNQTNILYITPNWLCQGYCKTLLILSWYRILWGVMNEIKSLYNTPFY